MNTLQLFEKNKEYDIMETGQLVKEQSWVPNGSSPCRHLPAAVWVRIPLLLGLAAVSIPVGIGNKPAW